MNKKAVAGIVLALLAIGMIGLAFCVQQIKAGLSGETDLLLETDKDVYALGENVTITLTNVGDDTVMFGGWPPWIVYTYPDWERVYPKAIAYLAWNLDPGQSVALSWNQSNEYSETFVGPGRYVVYEHNYDHTVFFDVASSASCVTDDLNLTLTVSQPTIVVGEELNITISTINIGSENITLQPRCGSHVFDITAFNETLSWKWSEGKAWLMIVYPPINLSLGETYVEQKEWNLYIYLEGELRPPAPGNYTLAVLPLCTPLLYIRIISPAVKADVNHDGEVDIYDVVTIATAFGSRPGDLNWNSIADLVKDGAIDIFDVIFIAKNFGKTFGP